jgi:ATP-binding cassette, subfamily B, bacterial PglK
VQENAWLGALYDWSGATTPLGFLLALGVFVVVAYLGSVAFKAAASYMLNRYGIMRTHTLAQRMLLGYLGQPYAWFLGRHSADLTKNVLGEVGQVVNGVLIPFLNLIANAVLVICLLALLILVNPGRGRVHRRADGRLLCRDLRLVRRRVAALGASGWRPTASASRACRRG